MTISFRPGKRENVSLLIGLAGGTGSGKTMSAFELAKGLSAGRKFAVIDTEAGRALHYADLYDFDHADLTPPFRPEAYADAIKTADEAGYPVIVVDSTSHEHAGEGGLLDWHEAELDRMAGTDWKKREALTFAAWVKPKQAHKQMVNRLLQVRAHLILCFRAQQSIEIVKDANGKTVVQPKRSLTGLDGWIPVSEKNLPYELTLSFLVTADAPGVPKPIKLPAQLRPFFPLDKPVSAGTGVALAGWAAGGSSTLEPEPQADDGRPAAPPASAAPLPAEEQPSGSEFNSPLATDPQRRQIFATAKDLGLSEDALRAIFQEHTGQTSSAQIPAGKVNDILAAVAATPPEAAADVAAETAPTGGGGGQQVEGVEAGTAPAGTDGAAPSTPDTVALAGMTIIETGQHNGKTIREVVALGETWTWWALRRLGAGHVRAQLETFIRGTDAEMWARYEEWKKAAA